MKTSEGSVGKPKVDQTNSVADAERTLADLENEHVKKLPRPASA
jgi:hypothetical protein